MNRTESQGDKRSTAVEGRRANSTRRAGQEAQRSGGCATWLGHVDPMHEAGKKLQRITKGTLRATEAWTDGRHAEDGKNVELDYELAVALASATEGAAMSTVLKVSQAEPSHGFVAWQEMVDGYAPKSLNDPAMALQPTLSTPTRCKDAKECKEKLKAWSLKVAEFEHQFKVVGEAQKTFVVTEMMPKDIRREFLTSPKKFDEIMEKLEIINETVADDGPVPMDLGNVGGYDARMMQSSRDMNNEISFDDMCAIRLERIQSRQRSKQEGTQRIRDVMNG